MKTTTTTTTTTVTNEEARKVSKAEAFKIMFESTLNMGIQLDMYHGDNVKLLDEYVDAIGCYNGFKPSTVKTMLHCIDEIIPRKQYNEGNPNNGLRDYKVTIGRESSPCIYIVTGKSLDVIHTTVMEQIAMDCKADEFSHKTEETNVFGFKRTSTTIRIWFD